MMFFQMEIHQDVDLIFKRHLRGPVAPRCQRGKIRQGIVYRSHQS